MKTGIVGRFIAPVFISAAALGAASQAKADIPKTDAMERVDARVLVKVSEVETDDQKTKNDYNPMFPVYLFALGGSIASLVIIARTTFNMEDRATW